MHSGNMVGLRSDTRRNLRSLIKAAGELAREDPSKLSIPNIAERAQIGSATAYRYYSTVDHILAAYVAGVVDELREFTTGSASEGRDLFLATLRRWMQLLDEHGAAIIQLRSRRGFLERLDDGELVISALVEAWQRPVMELMDHLGIDHDQLKYAMFLLNIMFDAREIEDLRARSGFDDDRIVNLLASTYIAALDQWGSHRDNASPAPEAHVDG